MTTKRKPKAPEARTNKLEVAQKAGESREAAMARAVVSSCVTAAAVSTTYTAPTFGAQSLAATCDALRAQVKRVNDGDLTEVEATLVAQAAALNSMFTNLACVANTREYMQQLQAFMKLALRAQNQCRMTLETLATIKNPPVVFAKQANMGQNVQVNNDGRARENEKPQPELLEAPHAKPQWMDTGAARTPAPSGQKVEAVGTVHRAKDCGRKGKVKP